MEGHKQVGEKDLTVQTVVTVPGGKEVRSKATQSVASLPISL